MNAHHTAISLSPPWSIAFEWEGMEKWTDREERIEGAREDMKKSRGRRGAEMKESDLNRKEGRRREGEAEKCEER